MLLYVKINNRTKYKTRKNNKISNLYSLFDVLPLRLKTYSVNTRTRAMRTSFH